MSVTHVAHNDVSNTQGSENNVQAWLAQPNPIVPAPGQPFMVQAQPVRYVQHAPQMQSHMQRPVQVRVQQPAPAQGLHMHHPVVRYTNQQ